MDMPIAQDHPLTGIDVYALPPDQGEWVLRRQLAAGTLDPEETIVGVLTGTGIKWPAQLDAALGPAPPLLPGEVDAILEAMEA